MDKIEQYLKRMENLLQAMAKNQKEIMTVSEVADYLDVSISHVYKWTSEKAIPHYKPNGKKIYFKKSAIHKWIEEGAVDMELDFDEIAERTLLKMAGRDRA